MDPLSIIASIAGIATAGVQLSNTLFHLTRTYRDAPHEVRSLAIEMSGLTVTLEHLRDILTTGHAYTKPLFFEGVRNVIQNIQSTQQEIQNLAKRVDGKLLFARLKWGKSKRLLSDIDKHKVTLTLQITILSAAVLVKSTNASLHDKSDNRFKIQAESLIQAGQASLQADKTLHPKPDPPRERAPSPPVRTKKRLPSPVRQSEIHVRTEDLYGQSSPMKDTLNVPEEGGDERYSVVARSSKAPQGPSHDANDDINDDESEMISEWGDEEEDEERKRETGTGFDPLSGRIAQFGRDFHLRGDAATFLYKLVYLDEVTAYKPAAYDGGSDQETEEDVYSDSSDDSRPRRVTSKIPSRRVNPERQEPGRVVNQLLLAWTSLSKNEIEKGSSESQPSARENLARQAYVVSEAEDEGEDDNERVRTFMPMPGSPHAQEELKSNIPEYNSRGRRILRPNQLNKNARNEAYRRPYLGDEEDEQSAYTKYSRPWAYAQAENAYEQTASSQPYSYSYPPGFVPPPPTTFTYPSPPRAPIPVKSTRPEPKPHVVILPYVDPANSELGPTTPKLDIAPCLNMSIVRQGEAPIWDCDNFMSQHGIPGKAIMGALAGDKNLRAMDLVHTLVDGERLQLVYMRGNDLGETWFVNERPVFLQFLHCGYLPQFYPAKEDDETAMQQEYVAIGEEWASFEALNLLGLPVKSRKEGRVFLDPSTNWSMIDELAVTTLQLRCMRQRRVYMPTFYNSIATFRQKHCEVAPPLCIAIPETEILPSTTPEPQPIADDEKKEVDVLSFLVKEEPPKVQEEVNRARNNTQSSNIQPQISITPPPTPKEVQTVEFDTSEVASNVSSRSRFSKFVKRYKSGRKQDRLPLPLPSHGSKTGGGHAAYVESEDEDKRPLTPTDSGVGSSIG